MLTLIDTGYYITGYRHSFIEYVTLHCLTSSPGTKPWFLIHFLTHRLAVARN